MTTIKTQIAGNRITNLNGATIDSNDGQRTITVVDGEFAVVIGEEFGEQTDGTRMRLSHTVRKIGCTVEALRAYRESLGGKRLIVVMTAPAVEMMMGL